MKNLATALSQSILKTDIHPILFFAINLLGLIQALLCFLDPSFLVYNILQWLDLSLYTDPRVLLYILAVPCILCGCSIILQIYWAGCDTHLYTRIPQHYLIKITTTIGYFISNAMCLTYVRCSIVGIKSQSDVDMALGITTIILYLLVTYPYTMFLLTDLSPQINKVYSVCTFPNSFTIMHFYKPIAALIVSSHSSEYVMIPTGFLFFLLIPCLLKYPIVTWQYNKISQALISCLIWMIKCRFIQLLSGRELTALVWFGGVPVFILCIQWLLSKRIYSIIQKQENTALKLKTFYFLLFNSKNSQEELSVFLISHYKACYNDECKCRLLVEKLKKSPISNQTSTIRQNGEKKTKLSSSIRKKKQESKDDNKINQQKLGLVQGQEKVAWYEFLVNLQNDLLRAKSEKFSSHRKQKKMRKGREIFLDQAQVLHHYLDKQYQSLICLWELEELHIREIWSLFLMIRHYISISKHEQTVQRKSKDSIFIKSATKFYEQQIHLFELKKLLSRAASAVLNFWKQLTNQKSNQKQLLAALRVFVRSREQILAERKKIEILTRCSQGEQQTNKWNSETRLLFSRAFFHFDTALMLSNETFQARDIQNQIKFRQFKHESNTQKNARIFGLQQKIGIATVNIQSGSGFGSISMTNPQFWELMGQEKHENPQVNHFLIKEIHQSHTRKMVNFLEQKEYFLNCRPILVPNPNNLILQLEISLHVLPHLSEGFFSIAYFQESKSDCALLLMDRFSSILGYNNKFKNKFLNRTSTDEYENMFSKQIFRKLRAQKHINLKVSEDREISLKLRYNIQDEENKQDVLYYCEVRDDAVEDFGHSVSRPSQIGQGQQKNSEDRQQNDGQPQLRNMGQDQVENGKIRNRNQEIEEKEKVKQFIEQLTSGRRSKNLKKWAIFVLVMLLLGATVSVITASLSSVKYKAYSTASRAYDQLTSFTQQTAKALYLSRKGNIASFNKEADELEAVYNKLTLMKDRLRVGKESLGIDEWKSLVPSYKAGLRGQIRKDELSLDVTLQINLLAPFTTYLQQERKWGFDLLSDNWNDTFPTWHLSFSNMLMNSYYTILPKLHSDFRVFLEQKLRKQIVLPFPLIPLCMFVVALTISIQIATIYFQVKVFKSVQLSLQLLIHLRMAAIKRRVELVQNYIQAELGGLERTQEQVQAKQSTISKQTIVQNSNNQMSEITMRNFEIENQINGKIRRGSKREGVSLKVTGISKTKPIFLIILTIFPIILFIVPVVGYQAGQNAYIWGKLQLISLHNSFMENIMFINSYSYEFAYEYDYFKTLPVSMSNQLTAILQGTYKLSHKIESAEAKQSSDYILFLTKINSLPFCDAVSLSCNSEDCQLCDDQFQKFYQLKSRSQVLVLYVETARSLLNSYKALNLTRDRKEKFMADSRHAELQKICQHLMGIQKYQMKVILEYYAKSLKYYQIGICIMCVSVVPIAIAIQMCWTGRKRKEMQEEASIAKTMIQLMTWREIQSNPAAIKHFLHNMQVYSTIL